MSLVGGGDGEDYETDKDSFGGAFPFPFCMSFSFSATQPLWIPIHPTPFRVDLDEVGLRLSQVLQG